MVRCGPGNERHSVVTWTPRPLERRAHNVLWPSYVTKSINFAYVRVKLAARLCEASHAWPRLLVAFDVTFGESKRLAVISGGIKLTMRCYPINKQSTIAFDAEQLKLVQIRAHY